MKAQNRKYCQVNYNDRKLIKNVKNDYTVINKNNFSIGTVFFVEW